MDELIMRVAKLERSSRRWRMVAVIAVLLPTAAVLMGAGAFFDFVLTGQLYLTDALGRPRIASIAFNDGSGGISLLDNNRVPRVSVFIASDGTPAMTFADSSGRLRAGWITLADGTSLLDTIDSRGTLRAALFTASDGSSQFVVNNSLGAPIRTLP